VNATPMSDALLPSSDSITFLDQEYDHQTNYRSVPMDFKARQLAVCLRGSQLSDVRAERNNAALHTAETAVASQRAAEIE
jgi:hypothetical protein